MQRLEYDRYGGPEVLHLSNFTLPAPKAGEVVVRVAAASINPMDWKIRSGQLKLFTGSRFPRGIGTDFSGTVSAVGPHVDDLQPGDDVVGTVTMRRSGAFAPMLITDRNLLVRKPANLSFHEAAVLPIAGVTAWEVLVNKARLKHDQHVFINGAMGAVGRAAIAIAGDLGARISGRMNARSIAAAKALELVIAVDYDQPLPASMNGMFDVVFDCNGSLSGRQARRLLRRGGKVFDIAPTTAKILTSIFFWSHKIVTANPKAENLQQVVDLAAAGKLAIPIARVLSLPEAPSQLGALEHGRSLSGKAVIAF